MSAVHYSYRYLHPSSVAEEGAKPKLTLATTDGVSYPYFFEGRVLDSALAAQLLSAVHLVVGSRFFTPANTLERVLALADPVVTSGGGVLRFEGFSSCCSTYIRVDLHPGAYEGDVVGKGTTNVDFNEPMRAALARIRPDMDFGLAIGRNELTVRAAESEVTERKVDLPVRWIRGMVEVQSYQACMRKQFEASPTDVLRLFRAMPKVSTSRTPLWFARGASGLYTTTRQVDGGVRVTDTRRLRVLTSLIPKARGVSVYADDAQQSSAWVLDFGSSRVTLALSAEVWRGFSGEGQALWALMRMKGEQIASAMARVRAQLQWQAALDPRAMAGELDLDEAVVTDTLRVLGASGLAGYDLLEGNYFHRVLPFDLALLEDLHPRIVDAQALLNSGAVAIVSTEPFEASVKSGEIAHRVRETDGALRCTCPWYARHEGNRGPCKHVLAAAAHRYSSN